MTLSIKDTPTVANGTGVQNKEKEKNEESGTKRWKERKSI